MMRIDILTLFPEMFAPLSQSMMKRATDKGFAQFHLTNIRNYAKPPHWMVDDLVYGGGAGMVMKPEPIMEALEAQGYCPGDKVILTSPAGKPFTQETAKRLAAEERLFIVCGHYEGIDQRVRELTGGEEISVGDYVLTGGELPAMVITDAVVRLLPGVLGDSASLEDESFNGGLLEQPQYTRPPEYRGLQVPEVLFSGDHRRIDRWRQEQSLAKTWENRPDLLGKFSAQSLGDCAWETPKRNYHVFPALVHYPVVDAKGRILHTSLTNLDIHDIARLAATYEMPRYYIVQPGKEQRELAETLLHYWVEGHGAAVNPDRREALSRVVLVDSVAEAAADIAARNGAMPIKICTSAKMRSNAIGYEEMRHKIRREEGNYLLIFGTGHGLAEEVLADADYTLKPVEGQGGYNHLSVRSAVAIITDRLLGEE